MKKASTLGYTLVILLAMMLLTVLIDARKNARIISHQERPNPPLKLEQNEVYFDLVKGRLPIDWSRLDNTLDFIRNEYDCSDFRLVNLLRILYEFGDEIPAGYRKKIEEVLFNFRFWWYDQGGNSMCYWSENHQILFASAEYLVGQLYPDIRFTKSQLTGREHMDRARQRAMDWMQMRWDHGFIEYYSSVYYKEDIAALINLIDFAEDHELIKKCQIIMDLLFYDVATQSLGKMFSSVSGRAYQRNRMGREAAEFGGLTNYLWGSGEEIRPQMMYGMMRSSRYRLPPVLKTIALDTSTVIIRQSNGLDISELKREGYYGTDNRSMMMQWGMESFTNPEIVRNSLAHLRNCDGFSNYSQRDFKILNYRLLDWLHLEPLAVRIINPQSNGIAIQKGNTYTYRTDGYSMYTVQNHHPGAYADQQHVFGMNIGGAFSIFHNHPALEKDMKKQSPNYWVGYGHFPHSVQDRNVNLSIYNTPKKKGIMEMALLDYTRAYFPSADFDTVLVEGPYAFAKRGNTYCAFVGASDFRWRDEAMDDLIQDGKQSFWITEAGSLSEDGSFYNFVKRIKSNPVHFDPMKLSLEYSSRQTPYELTFGKEFRLNGEVVNTEYPRYDSPYVQGNRKDPSFTFSHDGLSLHLDFAQMIREF